MWVVPKAEYFIPEYEGAFQSTMVEFLYISKYFDDSKYIKARNGDDFWNYKYEQNSFPITDLDFTIDSQAQAKYKMWFQTEMKHK